MAYTIYCIFSCRRTFRILYDILLWKKMFYKHRPYAWGTTHKTKTVLNHVTYLHTYNILLYRHKFTGDIHFLFYSIVIFYLYLKRVFLGKSLLRFFWQYTLQAVVDHFMFMSNPYTAIHSNLPSCIMAYALVIL